jgi:hypothetical protein
VRGRNFSQCQLKGRKGICREYRQYLRLLKSLAADTGVSAAGAFATGVIAKPNTISSFFTSTPFGRSNAGENHWHRKFGGGTSLLVTYQEVGAPSESANDNKSLAYSNESSIDGVENKNAIGAKRDTNIFPADGRSVDSMTVRVSGTTAIVSFPIARISSHRIWNTVRSRSLLPMARSLRS